ncbi:MAG: HipA domain-containing protein [Bacteroidetes bacterium]|nr:HipA domain-containing protein [Bacteroidota bacterium]
MKPISITNCPGTLKAGNQSYSVTALKRLFNGRKVSHILPYKSPASNHISEELFDENRKIMSISGVQEKFSLLLDKNKLRLINKGETGQYILKPIPNISKNSEYMPANEHLTMQIARQVFNIETAENALIFFSNGEPAYITKRFDFKDDGTKRAQEDFAALAQRSAQSHGEQYKYLGNYKELFDLLKKFVPAYNIEAPKLLKLLLFNYLFSNGDAHFKNFSLIQTDLGDYKLSPAYDLLNSRIHIADKDFALDGGLLPELKGKVHQQFYSLGQLAGIKDIIIDKVFSQIKANQNDVLSLIEGSYLSESLKRNYRQAYLSRLKKLNRDAS